MPRRLFRYKSLPALNTAVMASDPADKTEQNGSAVPAPAESEAVDPAFLKPFERGFKREIVMRATQDLNKKLSDIYYHTPEGHKLRSRPELAEYLARNPKLLLTLENFTFVQKPIYHPPLEVARQASRRGNNDGALPGKPTAPAWAPRSYSSAPARSPLLGSLGEEPAADAPDLSCGSRNEGLSMRRSMRKECPCCTEPLHSRKRRRSTQPPNTAPPVKRGRKPGGPGSQPTKAQSARVGRPRGVQPSNGQPATPGGPGRPPKRQRAQSLGRLPKPTADSLEGAKPTRGRRSEAMTERERRAMARRSLRSSPTSIHELGMPGESDDESSSSDDDDDDFSLESSSKQALVLLKDVLREGEALPKFGASSGAVWSSGDSGSVVPSVLRAHVPPWQNSVSWEIYNLLSERKTRAGGADGEDGETSAPKPDSDRTEPQPSRQGKGGCEDEEQCAADLLNGGPTIVEDSTEALQVVLEDAETGSSRAWEPSLTQRNPTQAAGTTKRSRQQAPASVSSKETLSNSGAPSVLCSISCPQALGQTPQLVCSRCLCHFHPVCVGLKDIHPHVTRGQFMCKPCSKASYRRVGKGSSPKSSTQPAPVGSAASGVKPSQAQGPSTALVSTVASTVASTVVSTTASTVVSTTAVLSLAPCPTVVTSVGGVLAGAGTPLSTVSMPMLQLVSVPGGHGSVLPSFQFVCVSPEPQSVRPGLLPPTLAVGAPALTPPVRMNSPPLRMPTLTAAPRPLSQVTAVVRSPVMPTVRLQRSPPTNSKQYYAIHLKHKLSDIDMASLSAVMTQAAGKGPAELQRACNGQGVVLRKTALRRTGAPQPSQAAAPSPSSLQTMAPLQPGASVSQSVVTAPPTSAAALQPVSKNFSVLKRNVVSESSTASAASVPTSAATSQPPAAVVSAEKPGSENVLPVMQGQPQTLPSAAGTNSQPAASVSACVEAPLKVPKGKRKAKVRTAAPGTHHRAILPKQLGETQAVPVSEPSTTASVTIGEADCVVRAAPTTAPQETAAAAGIPRPGEHLEAAVEERRYSGTSMATFCRIENVVSMAAAENEWPPASDNSDGEGRLVIVEGEGAEGPSNHNHVDESSSKTKEEATNALVSSEAKKPSEHARPLTEPPVPPTPPSDSNLSAEATESSASEQGPNDARPSGVVRTPGPRKVARVKRVKRRKPPLNAGASLSTFCPIWIRTRQQMTFVRDRSSSVDPLALHRDVVPNSARAFADLGCAVMALDSVLSWLPLPSLCSAAQVSKSWNIAANSPFLWRRIDFRQFRVKDWDACVLKMRFRCPEELILDGESLDHLLPYAEHLGSVERLSLEVNPRQLSSVSRAFPVLKSLRAVVGRKGSAAAAAESASQNGGGEGGAGEPQPPRQASLGCLTELLCIQGLERLALSGAHGLALLSLNMSPACLAQRCQQLRSLSLTTVQQLSPVVVFPISLLEQLQELCLGNCTNWSNACFVNLGQLRDLRQLTLDCGEDGPGFRTMLLKLNRLEHLALNHWTLRDSLCDVLPRMKRLRSLLLWPHINSLASRTHRNTLRSGLSGGGSLERFTWIVGCKQVRESSGHGTNKSLSLSVVQHVAPNLQLTFEPGTLCGCQVAANRVPDSSEPSSNATEAATSASPNIKGHNSASSVGAGNTSHSSATSSRASSCSSPRKSTTAPASNPTAPCCPLAQKISEVWQPDLEQTWRMTLRQLRDGLQHVIVPRTTVCVCLHVES